MRPGPRLRGPVPRGGAGRCVCPAACVCMGAAGARARAGNRGPHLTLGGTRAPKRPLAPLGLSEEKRNAQWPPFSDAGWRDAPDRGEAHPGRGRLLPALTRVRKRGFRSAPRDHVLPFRFLFQPWGSPRPQRTDGAGDLRGVNRDPGQTMPREGSASLEGDGWTREGAQGWD